MPSTAPSSWWARPRTSRALTNWPGCCTRLIRKLRRAPRPQSVRAGNSIARGGRLRTALLPSEQTSDEVDALAAAQRDRYRTQAARLVLAVMPARRRMHVSAGRTSSVSQIASCASAGIVSYGPVCRLAPADGGADHLRSWRHPGKRHQGFARRSKPCGRFREMRRSSRNRATERG